jgi:hypothetical protein
MPYGPWHNRAVALIKELKKVINHLIRKYMYHDGHGAMPARLHHKFSGTLLVSYAGDVFPGETVKDNSQIYLGTLSLSLRVYLIS